jgi:hypothetical protein
VALSSVHIGEVRVFGKVHRGGMGVVAAEVLVEISQDLLDRGRSGVIGLRLSMPPGERSHKEKHNSSQYRDPKSATHSALPQRNHIKHANRCYVIQSYDSKTLKARRRAPRSQVMELPNRTMCLINAQTGDLR